MKKELKFSIDTPNYLRLKSDGKNESFEVAFKSTPIKFTILNSVEVLFKPKSQWKPFDGSGDLEIVFIDKEFDNKISGYLTEIDDMNLSLVVSCSGYATKWMAKNFKAWNDVDMNLCVEIEGAEINANNFRMLRKQYQISSWSLSVTEADEFPLDE